MATVPIKTIVLYPRLQVDTIAAYFLLHNFGEEKFPGIKSASLEFWNQVKEGRTAEEWETAGYLLVDLGQGKFDHHSQTGERRDCASTLIAKYLGMADDPALRKILVFAKRDDLEGRGIVSKDVIDKTFGLPAIIMNLARDYPDHPQFVVEVVSCIYLAIYHEEYRRKVLMPKEWQELQAAGKTDIFITGSGSQSIKVVMVQSDSKTIAGFLRAVKEIQADLVVQRSSTGHVNLVTRQRQPRLDLKPLAKEIRKAEAMKRGIDLAGVPEDRLLAPGKQDPANNWYYDTAANTLQNGGVRPEGVEPTKISDQEFKAILQQALPLSLKPSCP